MARSTTQKFVGKEKSLVVFLPWLGATEGAVAKYEKLYESDEGYKFFVHYTRIKDFLWPKSGFVTSRKVLDELKTIVQKDGKRFCRIIIHAFSIGCFFYSLMIWQIRRNMDEYESIWRIIALQIMDSPVLGTTTEMAIGVSKMMSQRTLIASMYKNITLLYFALTKTHTVSYYDDVLAEVRYHAPNVPSLLMTSDDDPMCLPQVFSEFRDVWRNSKYVVDKVWQDSKHAHHLSFHPDEYRLLVRHMLESVSQQRNCPLQSKL